MQLCDRQIQHIGVEKEREELAHAEIATTVEHQIAANADDAEKAELGGERGGWAVERPAEHGFEGLGLEVFGAVLKAGGLALLQAKGLDQPIALNVLDQQAVELARAFAHALPDHAGAF